LLNTAGRRGGGNPLAKVLLVWLAVSVLILVAALFVSRATRGYRLKLTTRIDGPEVSEIGHFREWQTLGILSPRCLP
jgi:hypothetical protein